jgi:hypothetical protein
MSEPGKEIEEAEALLAAGKEAKALEILHSTAATTPHDPGLLREIHELATRGHDSSSGFHKLEWRKLMIETEPHTTARQE